ncbi:TonB-dependent receptor [Nitrospirillum amazonense]|uniref:TonB-dependent receptor n=1 Tax=Nitrospirillum amazonense TaxID=28077 RepID=UPI00241269F7|nr:TonB-dependent receptor [Nitrospirillum amazonense]MDG3444309.1 TonB-dependent receptor [Nitrospirillum amazonense]
MSSLRLIRRARALGLGATALVGGCLATGQVWAQAQTQGATQGAAVQPQNGASAAPADTSRDLGLEEILVTAEKRAEGLQNIPIAITAVSGETLEKAGVKEVGDLVQLAPSLQFGTRSTNVFIAMRGIGQAGQDIGSQSGVTVSLDGVPLLNHFMMNPSFLDVERVEVLRGPQGTIQGRNATGGAINVNSKAPTDQTDAELALTGGNYARFGAKGFVNVPLSDKVLTRVSFQRDRADGWTDNAYLGRHNDNADLTEVRGQLLVKPSEIFSISALVDYTRDRSDPSFNLLLGRADPARPTPAEVPGYAYPRNNIDDLTFYFNEPNQRDVEDVRATLTAHLDLGPDTSITSTTGFIKHDIDLTNLDVDLTPVASARFDLIGLYAKQVTQELTATTDVGSRADLVAGLFYMHGDSSEPLYLSTAAVKNLLVYLPAETLDSYAAYAQFRYNLTDNLRATAGGRYTLDSKSYAMDATSGKLHYLLADKDIWKAFTPRFVLDYAPQDNTLVYASVSRGFKSGGFNTLGDITQPVNFFNPEYVWNYEIGTKAKLFDNKLRMGLTAFYADYTNLQQTVFRTNVQTGVQFPKVENSSAATIKGVEFEVEAILAEGLKVAGAATRLDTAFGKFCNNDPLYPALPTAAACVGVTSDGQALPPGAKNLEGNTLTQAPKWQFNVSGEYVFPVSSALEVTARADYKWQSRVYFDIYNNPLVSQDGYGLFNASIGLGTFDKAWSLTGWVRNAFDVRYISQANTSPGATAYTAGSIGMPRMYGATLYHRF